MKAANPKEPPLLAPLPNDAHYQAIGFVPGRFIASDTNPYKGVFLLDGEHLLKGHLLPRRIFKTYVIDPLQNYNWLCYPSTDNEGNIVELSLLNCYSNLPNHQDLNYFNIRGKVVKQKSGIIIVKIQPQNPSNSFKIRLNGYVANNIWKQIWHFKCYREEKKLLIEDGKFIAKLENSPHIIP